MFIRVFVLLLMDAIASSTSRYEIAQTTKTWGGDSSIYVFDTFCLKICSHRTLPQPSSYHMATRVFKFKYHQGGVYITHV